MCLGRIYSAQKEETVDIRKGPSLRVKKGTVRVMLFPGRVSKKKVWTFNGELVRGMLG